MYLTGKTFWSETNKYHSNISHTSHCPIDAENEIYETECFIPDQKSYKEIIFEKPTFPVQNPVLKYLGKHV